jgi:hypothetical protein
MAERWKSCEYATRWEGATPVPCGKRSVARYPAAGGGFMHLCGEHTRGHDAYVEWRSPGRGNPASDPARSSRSPHGASPETNANQETGP